MIDPLPAPAARRTGRRWLAATLLLAVGVVLPATAIGFELATRLCTQILFDPLATPWHVALVGAVPLANLGLWLRLRCAAPPGRLWLLAGGGAAAVAAFYALVFLPLYPLAVIAIAFDGLGLLPLAPLAATIAAGMLTRRAVRRARCGARPAWIGMALGLAVVTGLDLPSAATRLAVVWSASDQAGLRQRGLALMRLAGDREVLLRLCYDSSGRPSGLLTALVMGWRWLAPAEDGTPAPDPEDARELYYRLTGDPFDSVPPPYRDGPWSFARAFDVDADQGGAAVGGRVAGLALERSRIDGSMAPDDAVAYLEWTLELRNDAARPAEGRMSLALPPGGVVSRATLWIDGEEREAAVAARAVARRAYEGVVQRRRDPLLVTAAGADRVLVQAFPVPAGGRLRLRLGITAPLALPAGDRASLALPAIVDRNFSIPAATRHAVWIEGGGRLVFADPDLAADAAPDGAFRARGDVPDGDLARRRPRLVAARRPDAGASWTPAPAAAGPAGARTGILQTIAPETVPAPAALMIVLDGSGRAEPARAALLRALALIPEGAPVGLIVAGEPAIRFDPAPWSKARRAAVAAALAAARSRGGQDNEGALADAVLAVEGVPGAALLWIAGPQPVRFRRDAGRLDQALDRAVRLPALTLYAVGPGPNRLLGDRPWFWTARSVAWSGDPAADLAALLAGIWTAAPHWRIARSEAPPAAGLPRASGHVARLWAAGRVLALATATATAAPDRAAAVALAAAYRLVTPVSGAVVLERRADYLANGLTPPDADAVPTIPEPDAWALLAVACLLLAALIWQGQAARARAA